MNITYNPFFDPQLSPALERGKVSFGSKTVGQDGLLDELMMRCGMAFATHPAGTRIISLIEALGKGSREYVWSRSFKIDPAGVAREIISWRDNLMQDYELKDLRGISRRLDDLADVSCKIPAGSVDAWLALEDRLRNGGVKPLTDSDVIDVTVPERLVRGVVRRVLTMCGATVRYRDGIKECAGQKVTLYKSTELTDAYEWAAGEDLSGAIVIASDNRRLNSVLRHRGLPVTGSRVEAGIPAPVQVLRMGLALLERPLNVNVLLSYLQCQQSPVPLNWRRRLARALAKDGGFGDEWDKVMESIDEDDRKCLDAFLFDIIEAPAEDGEGMECKVVLDYLCGLRTWAGKRVGSDRTTDEERVAFLTLKDDCDILIGYLSGYGESIALEHLSNIVSGVCEGVEIISEKAELGCLSMAKSPLALDTVPGRIVWLDCCGEGTVKYPFDFLTKLEADAVSEKKGIISREDYARLTQQAVLRMVEACPDVTLFSPSSDMGELLAEHPVVTSCRMKGVKETPFSITRHEGPKISFRPRCEMELHKDLWGGFSRRDSQSSIEKLIEYPFDYVTDYVLQLYDSSGLQLQDVRIVKGLVAHLFIESLVKDCHEDLDKMKELLNTEFDGRFAEAVRRKGLVLNLRENRTELVIFRKTLRESVQTLIGILGDNALTPVECESGFEEGFALDEPIGEFGGSVDFITRRRDGSLVVIDFKWSESSFYEGKLKNNTAIQLELYRVAVEKREKKRVSAVGYYLFPKKTLYTCQDLRGKAVVRVQPDQMDSSLVTRIGNSIEARKKQLAAGTLEMAEGFAKENIAYARDNGDNVIPLPVKNGKKQSPFGQGAESTPHQVLKDLIK